MRKLSLIVFAITLLSTSAFAASKQQYNSAKSKAHDARVKASNNKANKR